MNDNYKAGYMGLANLNGKQVRVSSFNLNLEQEALFYDHTIGLRDNVPTGILTSKGDRIDGGENIQKAIYRPSVVSVGGGLAYPLQSGEEDALFNEAKTGADFEISYAYACNGPGLNFYSCKVNSYTLNMTAGDVITASANIMAINAEDMTANISGASFTESRKLITWDEVEIIGLGEDIMSFTMTINNNCSYVYTSKNNVDRYLRPSKIRVGMQTVTGNIVYYGKGKPLSNQITISDPFIIEVRVLGLSFKLNCMLYPIKREGSMGVLVTTIPFIAVGKYWS